MKGKKSNIVLILTFIAMISLPQLVFWIMNKEIEEVSQTENRKLNAKPEFKIATITEYPKKFDDYYNDHLPFRTELKNFWTNLNYDLFNTTVDSRVVIGKEEWLFYRGNKSIEQVQGLWKYSEKEKEAILREVQNNIGKLKEKGIDTYILIIPNKENVYKEYLPATIPIKSDISGTEELIQYIKENSDIKLVYPKQELIRAKEKYQVYKKYDTHWNAIGSAIGTISLQKAIDPKFNYFDIEAEKVEQVEDKDLANFATLSDKVFEKAYKVTNFYPEITYERKVMAKYEEYLSNSSNNKTVLFIGDSFRVAMKEHFSKLYSRVIYIHQKDYTANLIEEIKPDIVVFETVERFSSIIAKNLL